MRYCKPFSLLLLGLGSCAGGVANTDYAGLVITFEPVCRDSAIWLEGSIFNSTHADMVIESGALPWQFDPLGTRFEAFSSGKELKRRSTYPTIGRFGPKKLQPLERRSGSTPIEDLFPAMRDALAKAPVTIRWTYLDTISGEVQITRSPCAP